MFWTNPTFFGNKNFVSEKSINNNLFGDHFQPLLAMVATQGTRRRGEQSGKLPPSQHQ
jgi:hypothetical protein